MEEARRDAAPDPHPGLDLRREGQPPQDRHRPPRLARQADRHRGPPGDRRVHRPQGLPGAPGAGARGLARLRGRPRPHRRPERADPFLRNGTCPDFRQMSPLS
ncbi:MAG: hypothetical protein MZW92_68835 [Comamonadaceae bacterium]|nr:hypothetical protein [Comamonadaceae bacterium]